MSARPTTSPRYLVIKKLQDSYDCDLDTDDTVGDFYEDQPHDKKNTAHVKAIGSFNNNVLKRQEYAAIAFMPIFFIHCVQPYTYWVI
jgi:hypothetical protein